jgi:hypothetical protein
VITGGRRRYPAYVRPHIIESVGACLAAHAADGLIEVTVRDVARRCGVGITTAHVALHRLIDAGRLIVVVPGRRSVEGRGRGARPTVYRVIG